MKLKKFAVTFSCMCLMFASGCGSVSIEDAILKDTIFADYVPKEEEPPEIFYGNKEQSVKKEEKTEEQTADDIINAYLSKYAEKEDSSPRVPEGEVDIGIEDNNYFSSTERTAMFEQIMGLNSYRYMTGKFGGATLTFTEEDTKGSPSTRIFHIEDDKYYYTDSNNNIMVINDGEVIGQDNVSGIIYPYKYILADGACDILFDEQKGNTFPVYDNGRINQIANDGHFCVVWETFTRAQLREKNSFLAENMGMSDTMDIVYTANAYTFTMENIRIYLKDSSGRREIAYGKYSYGRDIPNIPDSFTSLFSQPEAYTVYLTQDHGSVKEKIYMESFPASVYAKVGLSAGYYTYYADPDYQYPVTDEYHSGTQRFYTKSPFYGQSILYSDLEEDNEDIPTETAESVENTENTENTEKDVSEEEMLTEDEKEVIQKKQVKDLIEKTQDITTE